MEVGKPYGLVWGSGIDVAVAAALGSMLPTVVNGAGDVDQSGCQVLNSCCCFQTLQCIPPVHSIYQTEAQPDLPYALEFDGAHLHPHFHTHLVPLTDINSCMSNQKGCFL